MASTSNKPPSDANATWDAVTCNFNANGYRLPTDEEWVYMAKGGENYTYSGSDTIGDVAWYKDNSEDNTHEVKKKTANEYGMYDMSGNVLEFCWDWYLADTDRVMRGGSFLDDASVCAVSNRQGLSPASRLNRSIGFRVVRSK